jgi:hypothetical protein
MYPGAGQFCILFPPTQKNRNLYEVIWHNSVDTPEFSRLLTTHNTIHVTEIQFCVLQLRSFLLFLPVYFSSSQWLTARLTSLLLLYTKRQARDQYCGLQVNESPPPLHHTKWCTPRKGTDPLFHNFTVYCSLSPSGPHLDRGHRHIFLHTFGFLSLPFNYLFPFCCGFYLHLAFRRRVATAGVQF